MTNHRDVTPRSGHTNGWLTANSIPGLQLSVLLLIGYVALLGANSVQPDQDAAKPAAAGGPAIGYAMEAAAENGLTVEDLGQAYIDWLQAAHAHAALNGRDDPLPSQF